MTHLFVLDLTYIAGVDLADQHMDAHRAFLDEHYRAGTFLASGRKEPRTGGVIIAQGAHAEIEAIIAADPFAVHGLARYVVTEFIPTMTADALRPFQQ